MIWSFRRAGEALYLDVQYDTREEAYFLHWHFANRWEHGELYTNVFTFRARLLAVENELRGEGWTRVGPAACLRDAWRVK